MEEFSRGLTFRSTGPGVRVLWFHPPAVPGPVSSGRWALRHKGLEWITSEGLAWFANADMVVVHLAAGFRVTRHLVAGAALLGFAVDPRRVVLQVASTLSTRGGETVESVTF